MAEITVHGVPIEDLQQAKDIHCEGRAVYYPKRNTNAAPCERRGRKGTTKAKVFRRVQVELGDRFRSVEIIPQIIAGKIVHKLMVVEK